MAPIPSGFWGFFQPSWGSAGPGRRVALVDNGLARLPVIPPGPGPALLGLGGPLPKASWPDTIWQTSRQAGNPTGRAGGGLVRLRQYRRAWLGPGLAPFALAALMQPRPGGGGGGGPGRPGGPGRAPAPWWQPLALHRLRRKMAWGAHGAVLRRSVAGPPTAVAAALLFANCWDFSWWALASLSGVASSHPSNPAPEAGARWHLGPVERSHASQAKRPWRSPGEARGLWRLPAGVAERPWLGWGAARSA